MNGPPPRVVHVSPRIQGRGGIEALHEEHLRLPFAQTFVALFDRRPRARDGYINLDFTWRTPLGLMRRRFGRALAGQAGGTVIYHNGWGLALFHDLDGASRRGVLLHGSPAHHAPDLAGFAGLLDGAAGVTPALAGVWPRIFPTAPAAPTVILRAPVNPPAVVRLRLDAGGPVVLGYAGRVERFHKRLDRLPALLQALDEISFPCRLEVAGDGALRPALERRLGARVRFHGWLPKEDYWRVLAGWDGMVFFSDAESGPIALFEGLALGLVPFYPAIGGSWGDIYAPAVDPRCHYPPGDVGALARRIREVFGQPPAVRAQFRARARAAVASHTPEAYAAECAAWIRALISQPRRSRDWRRRFRATDLLPLGLVTRLAPWALRRA